MPISSSVLFDLETLLSTATPESILLIGDVPTAPFDEYQSQMSVIGKFVNVSHIPITQIDRLNISPTRHDLVILAGVLEALNAQSGRELLALIRDRVARQMCVVYDWNQTDSDNAWSIADFFSMGFAQVSRIRDDNENCSVLKYSLASYKRTPDWLNADNWANPELWGKYWW